MRREKCVKDNRLCPFYEPLEEYSYDGCTYGASLEDYKINPPCMQENSILCKQKELSKEEKKDVTADIVAMVAKLNKLGAENGYTLYAKESNVRELKTILENLFLL